MSIRIRAAAFLAVVSLIEAPAVRADQRPADALGPQVEQDAYHPEPRVIVNVLSVRGPHNPDRVQHDARLAWSRIVRCYQAAGAKERTVVRLSLRVAAAGKVAHARPLHADAEHRELARCLAHGYVGLSMPKARANSDAKIEIRLAPGDKS